MAFNALYTKLLWIKSSQIYSAAVIKVEVMSMVGVLIKNSILALLSP